jgi:hypothetical protein
MTEILEKEHKENIKELAEDSVQRLNPMCEECWNKNEDDPLGINAGVNTPYNKEINRIVDNIINNISEADEMWASEIRQEILDVFYQHRRWSFQGSSKKVNNEIECWYCYLERQESDSDVGILVENIDTNKMFNKDPKDWR